MLTMVSPAMPLRRPNHCQSTKLTFKSAKPEGPEKPAETASSPSNPISLTAFTYNGKDYTGKNILTGLRAALGIGPLGLIPAIGPLKLLPSSRCVGTDSILVALGLNINYETCGQTLLKTANPYVAQFKKQAQAYEAETRQRLAEFPADLQAYDANPDKLDSVNPDPTRLGSTFLTHVSETIDAVLTQLAQDGLVKKGTYYNFPNGHFDGWKITLKGLKSVI